MSRTEETTNMTTSVNNKILEVKQGCELCGGQGWYAEPDGEDDFIPTECGCITEMAEKEY